MKTPWFNASILIAACTLAANPAHARLQSLVRDEEPPATRDTIVVAAQPAVDPTLPPEPPIEFRERDLSGPRIGLTMAMGDGEEAREMDRRGFGRVVSQFGWHFEHQLAPLSGGPQLITEAIPMFGGVERGKLIPTMTMAIGIRLPSGYEFGMGPSLTIANVSGKSSAGLVIAAGKSLDYDGVSIPIDLAVSMNSKGARTTLTAGYAIRHSSRRAGS